MRIRVDHYHHVDHGADEMHQEILRRLARIEAQGSAIIATNADLLAALAVANEATNNIAADIQRILARETISDESKAAVDALVARLQGVASVVPEDPPPA